MPDTIEQFANFAADLTYEDLPAEVIHETRRLLLDSIGCALGAVTSEKGRWARDYAGRFFAGSPQASAIGYGDRLSVPGAAFVNAELINGLDQDAGMTPGHVSPFVIPPALAMAEANGASGRKLITALALAHEMSNRIGSSLGTFRDMADSKDSFPKVSGYSFSVFGGTAAVALLDGLDRERMASALGLAGHMAPMQAHATMMRNVPTTTAKYLMAGWAAQTQVAAAALARAGHRGDIQILDHDWGYWRFAGAARWDAAAALAGLGEEWRFHKTARYKIYPSCRIMHGALDGLAEIIAEQGLEAGEIEHVHAGLEPSCVQPVFQTRELTNQTEAQFSIAYNVAVLAHGIPPGPLWQATETMQDPSIRNFMSRVSFAPHPDYLSSPRKDPQVRVSRIEVTARGQTFRRDKEVAKGAPSRDPETAMTDADIAGKVRANSAGVIAPDTAERAIDSVMALEAVANVATLMDLLQP